MSATNQYTVASINGHDFKIPMVAPSINIQGKVNTPEWMISIDEDLASTIEGYEQCCELFGWYADESRLTNSSTANDLYSSATVQHSNVVVLIPNGVFSPILEQKMAKGVNISSVKITRLGNIEDMKKELQTVEYTECKIEALQQQFDRLIVSIRPETKCNTVYSYDQTGRLNGQNVMTIDFTKNTVV